MGTTSAGGSCASLIVALLFRLCFLTPPKLILLTPPKNLFPPPSFQFPFLSQSQSPTSSILGATTVLEAVLPMDADPSERCLIFLPPPGCNELGLRVADNKDGFCSL